jgi:hypothetical protein
MLDYKTWKMNEEKKTVYEYGCSMAYFNSTHIPSIQNQIDPDDIYYQENDSSYGLEKEHHVTLLYGLHHDKIDETDVLRVSANDLQPIVLSTASLFESEKFDILKFDADSKRLHEINKELSQFPHTSTYDYHPHATIAYLKPGTGKKYVEKFANLTETVVPNQIVYTRPDGTRATCDVNC